MSKSPIFPILPLLTHAACMFLALFVLISPAPFSISSVGLLKVRPYDLNSTSSISTSSSSMSSTGITFGGSSSVTSIFSQSISSQAPSITSISSSESSHSHLVSSITSPSASSTPSSVAPTPTSTSISARSLNSRQSSQLQAREQLSNMTGPGGIYLNSTEQSLLSNQTANGDVEFSSKIQLIFGPLGSCFTDGDGNKECTSAMLIPHYDSDKLKEKEFGSFVTSGLLDRLPTTPVLLLVVLVILILTLGTNILNVLTKLIPSNPTISTFLEAGPVNRGFASIRNYSIYASTVSLLILLCSVVSMRIYSSKAATSFNASNAAKSLPSNLVASDVSNVDTSNVLGLKAEVGSAFTMLWITLALMALLLFLERRNLKNERAVAQARSDIEARHGRSALSSVEVKPIQQLPYPNEYQPYGSAFNQYSSSGSIYNGYPVSSYGNKSRPSSPTPTSRTHITRAVSPAPAYRGGPMNSSSSTRSYWAEERSPPSIHHENGLREEMSWRLVGDKTGHIYN